MDVNDVVPSAGSAGGSQATGDVMQPGQFLNPGTQIISASGRYHFAYQGDGNLVLYDGGVAIWASNTAGRAAGACVMQGDGNLVIYIPGGQPIWASNTMTAGSHLILQNDGNVVIYTPSNKPVWATNTQVPGGPQATGSVMEPGQILSPDTEIVSASGSYHFRYQSDGNLVLYDVGVAIWASNTAGRLPGVCVMQGDGNLVIYIPGGQPIWASNTMTAGSHLIVQNDRNVVIYGPSNQPFWATNTGPVVAWQQQQQSNWCWAAVSSMISHYYNPASTWAQCAVATGTVNEWRQAHNEPSVNCCDQSEASSSDCNVTWGLQPPLQLVGNFASVSAGAETLSGVAGQVNAGCPVCLQVEWSGGGGHFLIIDGVDVDAQTVHVEDPGYGPGDYSYNTVATDYQGSGKWIATFLTTE